MSHSLQHETAFCYHCRAHHPLTDMRQVSTRNGKRWRCLRSIQATQTNRASRDAFGRSITEMHRAEAEAKQRSFLHPLPLR